MIHRDKIGLIWGGFCSWPVVRNACLKLLFAVGVLFFIKLFPSLVTSFIKLFTVSTISLEDMKLLTSLPIFMGISVVLYWRRKRSESLINYGRCCTIGAILFVCVCCHFPYFQQNVYTLISLDEEVTILSILCVLGVLFFILEYRVAKFNLFKSYSLRDHLIRYCGSIIHPICIFILLQEPVNLLGL